MLPIGNDTTTSPPETTNTTEDTTVPPDTTTNVPETTSEPETTAAETTAPPAEDTTAPPKETTVPPETTQAPDDEPIVPKKRIAFTFDDGPHYKTTPKVLDKLEELGARATFFVVGYNAVNQGKILKRAIELGCEVGNHTSDHALFSRISYDEIVQSVTKVNDIIENATGVRPTLLRPPYGEISKEAAVSLGMNVIHWSVDPEDWRYRDAQQVADHIIAKAKDGDIILMHDIYETSYEAFCIAADALVADGFELVTVSELLGLDETTATSGIIHKSVTKKK